MIDRFDVILLAAQRSGIVNPLAKEHGVSHKCLVPVAGTALIARVLETLTRHPGCRAIHVLVEAEGMEALRPAIDTFATPGLPIHILESSENIAESVLLGCRNAAAPYIITTADNVLLAHASIDRVCEELAKGADAIAALARKEDILAVHPDAQRFFYEFRDGGYANCNLYAIAGLDALNAAEIFRQGGQFMSNPKRLVTAFGLFNVLLVRFGWVTVDQALKRVSRRFSIDIRAVHLRDGTQAIDVDNERTYRIVEGVLTGSIAIAESADIAV